jgi:aminopeptidase N
MAQFFTIGAYPESVVTQQAIDATDSYIARNSPPPALARLLIEGRDDVARALRCRQRSIRASRE